MTHPHAASTPRPRIRSLVLSDSLRLCTAISAVLPEFSPGLAEDEHRRPARDSNPT